MNFAKHCIVKPGTKPDLDALDPGETFGIDKDEHKLAESLERLREQQQLLYADRSHALLIVLQALDAGGKDGTIRHVMSGVNPQGCQVAAFKVPTGEEKAHDFLWRIHPKVPELGMIGIFNRSHYEDVLVVRVHDLAPKEEWSKRYEQINNFERLLTENKVMILKFFLHISKDEQKRRFEERVRNPAKNWKLSLADFEERRHWDEYRKAYRSALGKCSTEWAPWYVIPANDKWRRNYIIADIIVRALEDMKLAYPPPAIDLSKVKIDD